MYKYSEMFVLVVVITIKLFIYTPKPSASSPPSAAMKKLSHVKF